MAKSAVPFEPDVFAEFFFVLVPEPFLAIVSVFRLVAVLAKGKSSVAAAGQITK